MLYTKFNHSLNGYFKLIFIYLKLVNIKIILIVDCNFNIYKIFLKIMLYIYTKIVYNKDKTK